MKKPTAAPNVHTVTGPEVPDEPAPMATVANPPVQATTTSEQDRATASQRKINRIWEFTQAFIAISITAAMIIAVFTDKTAEDLKDAFILVIALYFQRTNHTKVGGVGGTDDMRR